MNRVETLYLIHHSHMDIGYTHDQPIVWDLHGRFIDEAIRIAEKEINTDGDGTFRWTVENTAALYEWLKHAPREMISRFRELERLGRIEVTAMFANFTPLVDVDQLIESFQLVDRLREEYGLQITSAMNSDVNGENWPLVDLLLDLGIEGFTMAINTHFGGAPLNRPDVFHWEGPSGRKLLAYNGWSYDSGWRFGIGHNEQLLEIWWSRIQERLDEINYPIPILMVQSYHPYGDNAPPFDGFTAFINRWNAQGRTPHLKLATPRIWWRAVKQYEQLLPSYSGDWTDFWNFGSISSASEESTSRNSRVRLRAADAIAATLLSLNPPLKTAHTSRTFPRYRDEAWRALNLWDEHTWSADSSVHDPYSEDTASQWNHKSHNAYQARSLSLMLQRDALADLSRHMPRQNPDDLLLFNPLPWRRKIFGEIPYQITSPRGPVDDATSGRHSQDSLIMRNSWLEAALLPDEAPPLPQQSPLMCLLPMEVPGFGFTVVKRADLEELKLAKESEDAVVESKRFIIKFDKERGGVSSFFDKTLQREWVDTSAGYPINGFVHEEVADYESNWPRKDLYQMDWDSEQVERDTGWQTGWKANRMQSQHVLSHQVFRVSGGRRILQVLKAPGTLNLVQCVLLPEDENWVEFESMWTMGLETHPQANYLMFPFDVPGAKARIDLGPQDIIAGADQIPGVCYDYFTAQQWVDFSNGEFGVTVALPDNPMVQFGDFHFGDYQRRFKLERSMLLGWVTNNYWETNFRAHQPGRVIARYRVYPHAGDFDTVASYRWGQETANSQPLLQQMGESRDDLVFPAIGELLHLPESQASGDPVFTLHIKPARKNSGMIVRLYNADKHSQPLQIGSGMLRITSAHLCDLMENDLKALAVVNGVVSFQTFPCRVSTLRLEVVLADLLCTTIG